MLRCTILHNCDHISDVWSVIFGYAYLMVCIAQGSSRRSGLSAILHDSENPSLCKAKPVPSRAPIHMVQWTTFHNTSSPYPRRTIDLDGL